MPKIELLEYIIQYSKKKDTLTSKMQQYLVERRTRRLYQQKYLAIHFHLWVDQAKARYGLPVIAWP